MKVIGITGPTGAGKTTALNALVSLGGRIIDADAVYHTLTRTSQPMRQELEARFGPVYTPQGELDRKKLGAVVFQDPQALADLNAITHRYVGQAVAQQVAEAEADGVPVVGIDAIGLLESSLVNHCHRTVAVTAPEELRVKRIMAREGISEEYARLRVAAQKPGSRNAAMTPWRAPRPTRWRPSPNGPGRSLRISYRRDDFHGGKKGTDPRPEAAGGTLFRPQKRV